MKCTYIEKRMKIYNSQYKSLKSDSLKMPMVQMLTINVVLLRIGKEKMLVIDEHYLEQYVLNSLNALFLNIYLTK